MKFKPRMIWKPDGSVVVKVILELNASEVSSLDRIPDDPTVSLDLLRTQNPDAYLTWLRVICYWVDIWNRRDQFVKWFPKWRLNRQVVGGKRARRSR